MHHDMQGSVYTHRYTYVIICVRTFTCMCKKDCRDPCAASQLDWHCVQSKIITCHLTVRLSVRWVTKKASKMITVPIIADIIARPCTTSIWLCLGLPVTDQNLQ